MTAVVDTDAAPSPSARAGAFGNATHLVCRECGANTELGPFYACTECFGPLEVGYEFPTITRNGSRRARGASGDMPRSCRSQPTSPPSAPPTPDSRGWSMPATSRMILV